MTRIRWSGPALLDIDRIENSAWELHGVDYAGALARALVEAARMLASYPSAGRKVSATARKWTVPGTPCLLIYTFDESQNELQILRLVHNRENWSDDG